MKNLVKAQTNLILQKTKKMELIPYVTNNEDESEGNKRKKKTKTTAELEGVKTHKTLCIICQKNKKRIAPIRTAAGRKAILKSAKKNTIWF